MNNQFSILASDGRTILWFQNQYIRTREQAEQSIARKRKKEQKALPLLASIIDQASNRINSVEQIIQKDQERFIALGKLELENYQKTLLLRSIIGKFISPDELIKLDNRRFEIYPASVTYSWGFWFSKLKEIKPELAYKLCLNRHNHKLFSKWHDQCPTCGKKIKDE